MAEAVDPISLLFLSPRWQYDTYGVASVVRSLANDLWLTDPEGKRIQMTCALLQNDERISKEDIEDAKKHNVKLRGVQLPMGMKRMPTNEELDINAALYYHHLALTEHFDFIVGHIPYLANGTLNIRNLSAALKTSPKTILLTHALPRTSTNDIDEDLLLRWLRDSEIVFSIGGSVERNISSYIDCIDENEKPLHKLYIPGCPAELLTILQRQRTKPINGPQNIVVMTNEKKDLAVSGLDYSLAVASSTVASEHIHLSHGIQAQVHLMVLASNPEERNSWEESFNEIKERQPAQDKRLSFEFYTMENIEKLKSVMRRSTVMLLPLKAASSFFGVEALMAAYSGVPILVASNSGMASLLESMGLKEVIVHSTGMFQKDVKLWSDRIREKIGNPVMAQNSAKLIRKELLLDATIAASHVEFVKIVTDTSNSQLIVELDKEVSVLAESLAAARKFGVKIEERVEPNKYIAAYFTKLLLQRDKLDLGLLDSYLPSGIKEAWKEVLSCLEETNRKLLDVTEGSLAFTLFCPTVDSSKQLQDETWRKKLTEKLTQLLQEIGVIGSELKITCPEKEKKFQFKQPLTLPAVSRLRLQGSERDEETSSGYGTESVDPLDQMSIIHPTSRVADWLRQVEPGGGSNAASIAESTEQSNWTVVERFDTECCYPEENRGSDMQFSVGESGNLGIGFYKNKPDETDLLVLYPSKPNRSVTLSTGSNRLYFDPIFVKMFGKKHLAAHCFTDASIHLWDTESRTSRVVYREGSEGKKEMRLRVIDSETVAYGEVLPTDGVHHVYLLNTSTEQWSLRTTLRLRTGLKAAHDMCYTQHTDGTPCLVLCSYDDRSLVAVDMLGGNIRWRVGTKQMGEGFGPHSVCADENHNVYVCDTGQYRVHMLSAEGVVISTILTAQQHGILFPNWVRMYDDHLYVAHANNVKDTKWQISKFVKK